MGGGLVLIQGKSRILEDYRKKTYTSKEKDEQISNQLTLVEASGPFLFASKDKSCEHRFVSSTKRAIELNVALELLFLVRNLAVQEGLEILESNFYPTEAYEEC